MKRFSTNPGELVASFWRNRQLILGLARRDVAVRYRGSVAGVLWAFVNPLLLLGVYTFVFGVVFRSRWNPGSENSAEFALIVFSGLIVFNLFAECVTRAPTLLLTHASYVKKVVFPLEILPWVVLVSALFHALVSLAVWFVFYLLVFGAPPYSIVWLPVVLAPFLLLVAGVSWLLASLGVYLRDTAQFVGILTVAFLFLSPIFYPVSALPADYRSLLYLNPLTAVVEHTRAVLIWGLDPDWGTFALYWVIGVLVAWSGFSWFQTTRKGFADVL
jgi:lipopolysaccharide transport system permease protein